MIEMLPSMASLGVRARSQMTKAIVAKISNRATSADSTYYYIGSIIDHGNIRRVFPDVTKQKSAYCIALIPAL
jgi:hypothetical protein